MRTEKKVLSNIIILAVIALAILPFLTSTTDLLTRFLIRFEVYRWIQEIIVPYEMSLLKTSLNLLGFNQVRYGSSYIEVIRSGKWDVVYLSWNCIGWQSLVLFLATLFTGLSGRHTLFSKLETLTFGLLGLFFLNVFRLTSVVLIYQGFGRLVGIIYHDYIVTLLAIGLLFFFWWFAYSFILEEKSMPAPS
ncbi:MAG: hypothetical protein UT20_C0037G0008 [Candidatus Levybacteria bacterium GW2011_GWA1_39_11]|nr:MAG: hypothetical protein UT20_C0037G0008 [Candidatus Levybacteria bacterium GW2011_GWA1_39_11]